MRTALIVAGLLVSLAAQPQDIYKWVDKDGVVHYADQPGSPDAELVPYPGLGFAAPDDSEPPPLYEPERRDEPPVGPTYQTLRILSPSPDEVFYGGDVSVPVQVELDRDLRPGDTVVIFLDGQRVPDAEGLSATLTGLTRGTHFVRAAVTDENGSAVITSQQVTFHLRQASIATPATGPAVKPPARPPTTPPRPTPRPGR
jgi:hypothetical protein